MTEYIERDEAIAIIEEKQKEICPLGRWSRNAVYGTDRERFDAWGEIIDQIDAIPAADVAAVRHGRWVEREGPDENGNVDDMCSLCGHRDTHDPKLKVPFCWFCGAKMYKEAP